MPWVRMPWNTVGQSQFANRADVLFNMTTVQVGVNKLRMKCFQPEKLASQTSIVLVHPLESLGMLNDGMSALLMSQHRLNVYSPDLRGRGASSGAPTARGIEEIKDVNAICNWLHEGFGSSIILVGVGNGSCVAGSVYAKNEHVVGCVTAGYPLGFFPRLMYKPHYEPFFNCKKPKLMLQFQEDSFTSKEVFEEYAKTSKGPTEKIMIQGSPADLPTQYFDRDVGNYIARFVAQMESRESWEAGKRYYVEKTRRVQFGASEAKAHILPDEKARPRFKF